MTDFYSTLGVDRSADPETIKRAYRKLASQHHPDRGGDKTRFQEIQAAYDTLSDPNKRAQYDNPQPQGFHFQFGNGFPPGFENIFESHFGNGNPFGFNFNRPSKNRTINLNVQIDLKEAYFGKQLIANIQLPSGREQLIDVKIPQGIDNGNTIRVSGIGDDSIPNLPKGDINLTITVLPHSDFIRQGDDLIKTIEISCIDAMLGKQIEITSLDGKKFATFIGAGTQHGQFLSLNGLGMPSLNNPNLKGKLKLEIKIKIPNNLTENQINLLRQF